METHQNVGLCVTLQTFYYLREISILLSSFNSQAYSFDKTFAAAFSHGVIIFA